MQQDKRTVILHKITSLKKKPAEAQIQGSNSLSPWRDTHSWLVRGSLETVLVTPGISISPGYPNSDTKGLLLIM